ncbi:MAG: hypothetical protein EAZ77_10470 [Nostocales cyanobacterium]|nr:MAG: hypothetical protein EAZ77_10470 [Nostocales cyanobacterium]
MSTQLFATVSVEQQEIVAGGSEGGPNSRRRRQYDNVIKNESSYYQKEKVTGKTGASKKGAYTDFDALRITDTFAALDLSFDNH